MTTKALNQLNRIEQQIDAAQSGIATLNEQITQTERDLVSELAKIEINQDVVSALETKRDTLTTALGRMQGRITALEGTLPAANQAANLAELHSLAIQHRNLAKKITENVDQWRKQAGDIAGLQGIATMLRKQRQDLKDLEAHIRYNAKITGADVPGLGTPEHVTNSEIAALKKGLHESINTEGSAYYRPVWDERAQQFDDAQRGQERVTMREAAVTT